MIYINDFCSYNVGGMVTATSSLADLVPMQHAMEYAKEPEYKNVIPPMQLRRMSKPIRLSIAAVKHMITEASPAILGAINVGTAYGLLADSEQFLSQLVQQDEEMLTPTAFIQSTQNTIGGQIALLLQCPAHNMTFVQRGHSFEHALMDITLLEDAPADDFILGGVDEMTPHFYDIMKRLLEKYDKYHNGQVLLGEGATFFRLSKERKATTKCTLSAYEVFKAKDGQAVYKNVNAFLERQQIADAADIHWILGDINTTIYDAFYKDTIASLGVVNTWSFKPYTSDYPTVSAAGLAMAVKYLTEKNVEKVIVLHNYLKYWSVFLLER